MTTEEAINKIKAYLTDYLPIEDYEKVKEIIKALEQEPVIDKIRAEIIAKYPKNYADEPELDDCACEFFLNQILQIIDKHKAEMESKE